MAEPTVVSGGLTASMARLVYLLAEHKVQIPKAMKRYLPTAEMLMALHKGVSLAADAGGVPLEYLEQLYRRGHALGDGSAQEALTLIAQLVDGNISEDPSMTIQQRARIYGMLDRLLCGMQLTSEHIVSLGRVQSDDIAPVLKWNTGFTPFDIVTGGITQSIVVIIGKPGIGKTSLMFNIYEMMRLAGYGSLLFVENEIPYTAFMGRMSPVLKRTGFRNDDQLVCASWSTADILDYVQSDPDPERVIFFDSPDVVIGGITDEKRFYLEAAYQDLVRIKQLCRNIFVSSQPRRNDKQLGMESVAEAWAKAWYADVIVTLQKGRGPGRIQMGVPKNRFGPADGKVTFKYAYEDLVWEFDETAHQAEVEEDEEW